MARGAWLDSGPGLHHGSVCSAVHVCGTATRTGRPHCSRPRRRLLLPHEGLPAQEPCHTPSPFPPRPAAHALAPPWEVTALSGGPAFLLPGLGPGTRQTRNKHA